MDSAHASLYRRGARVTGTRSAPGLAPTHLGVLLASCVLRVHEAATGVLRGCMEHDACIRYLGTVEEV